jgi:P27 family predicted phage terminase small subunit
MTMGFSGPLPKPKKIAKVDGTHKSRIQTTLQDKVQGGAPPMPRHVLENDYAAAFWAWITAQIGPKGLDLLSLSDQKILEVVAGVYQAMRECEEKCRKLGRTVEIYDDDGELASCKRAPWDIGYRDYSLQLSKLLNELALTPTARARYAIPEFENTGDLEADTRRVIKKFEPDAS